MRRAQGQLQKELLNNEKEELDSLKILAYKTPDLLKLQSSFLAKIGTKTLPGK